MREFISLIKPAAALRAKAIGRLICLPMLVFVLQGCFGSEDLMRAPRPAVQYQRLQEQIEDFFVEGFVYSAPASGENRQAVMSIDLTASGEEDAVVLLRGETEHLLAVFLSEGGELNMLPTISENAETVHSIVFCDFDGDDVLEIIIGWQVSGLRFLSVYSINNRALTEIFTRRFSGFTHFDIKDGGIHSLLLVYASLEESLAELVSFSEEGLEVVSTAMLSRGAEALRRIRIGTLYDNSPALFVASQFQTAAGGGEVTDVIALRGDSIVNISANIETGISESLVRDLEISATDIDGDGHLDLPVPNMIPFHPDRLESEPFYEINWLTFDSDGMVRNSVRTYHNFRNGWYLRLPEEWPERYTVRMDNVTASQSVTVFSSLRSGEYPLDFLRIYHHSIAAATRPQQHNRIILAEQDNFIVTAGIITKDDGSTVQFINEELILELFGIIPVDWRAP